MSLSLAAVYIHFIVSLKPSATSLKTEETKDFDDALFIASFYFTMFSIGSTLIAFIFTCLIGLTLFFLVFWFIKRSVDQ